MDNVDPQSLSLAQAFLQGGSSSSGPTNPASMPSMSQMIPFAQTPAGHTLVNHILNQIRQSATKSATKKRR